jgi:hypothetical protein
MNFRHTVLGAALGLATLGFALQGTAVLAQQVYPAAKPKGQYHKLDALPDWGGVWILGRTPGAPPAPPAPKGKYLEQYNEAKRLAETNNGDASNGVSHCTPPGMPGGMGIGQYPIEFLFTPGRVTNLQEAWTGERRIYTDGRPHPTGDDLDPTFYGHSIGHWEGDTLVVDTVGVKDSTQIAQGVGHSDKLRIGERIHLAKGDPNTLVDEMTVTDPEALERPFNRTFTYKRHRDEDLLEFICAENDRNPVGEGGKTEFERKTN